MSDLKTRLRPAPAYDTDFYAWTQGQAALLRELRPKPFDWQNIAEEIESLGSSQRSEIRSRLIVALTHLLKWTYQPEKRTNSWRASILGARKEIGRTIKESPSLRQYPQDVLQDQYEVARLDAAGETGLDLSVFPESCPFTVDQVLDPDYLPERPRG